MSTLKLENSLALHQTTLSIVKKVIFSLKQLEQYESKKYDGELVKSVCRLTYKLIKTAVKEKELTKKQSLQIDNKVVVMMVLKEVFSLTEAETNVLESQIDFILENKLLQNRKLGRRVYKFFCRIPGFILNTL